MVFAVTPLELESTGSLARIGTVGLHRRGVVVNTTKIETEGPGKGQHQLGHQRGTIGVVEPI